MADEKLIQPDKISSYVTEKVHGDKLKNPDKIAQIVMSAFSSVENNGFLPAGDFTTAKGKELATQWNESLKNLFDQISNPSQSILNPNISYQSLLEADAKGTEIKRYLDPTPLKNRLDQTYEDARSDEFPMNVMHMDYTNDLGDYTKSREFQYAIQLFSLFDFNGDGVLDGQTASYDEDEESHGSSSHKGDMISGLRFLLTHDARDEEQPLYKFVTSLSIENKDETKTLITGDNLRNYLINCLNESSKEHNSYEGVDRISYLYECINDEGESGFFVFNGYKDEYMKYSHQINPLIISPNGPYKTAHSKIMEVVAETEEERKNKIYKIISKIAEETVNERYEKMTELERRLNRTNGKQIYITYMMRALLHNGSNRNYIRYRDAAERLFESDEYQAIRLLMPQYARRVEVEDLNKNFWVIGQVLDALAQGLLGPNGIYASASQMCEELGQLWQNTAFLWNLVAELASKSIRYYDDDIGQLKKQIELLKQALGFGEVEEVTWSLSNVEAPHIAMGQNLNLNTFKVHFNNQFGSRAIDNIIATSRIRPTSGYKEEPLHFTAEGYECDGTYDMRGTVERMNQFFVNSKSDNKVDIAYLTISNDKMHTQADFINSTIPAFITEEEKQKEYGRDKCLATYLNEEDGPTKFFRVIPNFSIVCYDRDYYKITFEEQTINLVTDKTYDGTNKDNISTLPIVRKVAKISYNKNVYDDISEKVAIAKQNIEKYTNQIEEIADKKDKLQKAFNIVVNTLSTLKGEALAQAQAQAEGMERSINNYAEEIEELNNKILDNKAILSLEERLEGGDSKDLSIFQDSPDKIIFYLPHSKCYEGDIFKIDFKDFYIQDCVPKTSYNNEHPNPMPNNLSEDLAQRNEKADYWNGNAYKIWRSTFDRVRDEEYTAVKKAEINGQLKTEILEVKRPAFDVNNKIIITYRNGNMLSDKYLENKKMYLNASLLRTDIMSNTEGYNIGVTTSKKETKHGVEYDVPVTTVQYQDFERCPSNYTTFAMPGVVQNGVAHVNNARALVVNDLIANHAYPTSATGNVQGKVMKSIFSSDAVDATIRDLVGAEKNQIQPIFGVFHSVSNAALQNSYYYPNTLFYFHAITYPHMYDFAITSIMCSTEAQNVSYRGNQISKIKLYGTREGKQNLAVWEGSKVPTDYWRIQKDHIMGKIGNRNVIVDFITDEEYFWKNGHHFYGHYNDYATYYFTPSVQLEGGETDYFIGHRMALMVEGRNGSLNHLGEEGKDDYVDISETNGYGSSQLRSKEIYIGGIMQQPTAYRSLNENYIDTTLCIPYLYTLSTPVEEIVTGFEQGEFTNSTGTPGNMTIIDKPVDDKDWYSKSVAYSSFEALSGPTYNFEGLPKEEFRYALNKIQFDKCPETAKCEIEGELTAIVMVNLNGTAYLMSTRCGSSSKFEDRQHLICPDGKNQDPSKVTYKFITRENFRTIRESNFYTYANYNGTTALTNNDIEIIFGGLKPLTETDSKNYNEAVSIYGKDLKSEDVIWKAWGAEKQYAYHKATCKNALNYFYDKNLRGILDKETYLNHINSSDITKVYNDNCCGCSQEFIKNKFNIT